MSASCIRGVDKCIDSFIAPPSFKHTQESGRGEPGGEQRAVCVVQHRATSRQGHRSTQMSSSAAAAAAARMDPRREFLRQVNANVGASHGRAGACGDGPQRQTLASIHSLIACLASTTFICRQMCRVHGPAHQDGQGGWLGLVGGSLVLELSITCPRHLLPSPLLSTHHFLHPTNAHTSR